MAITTIPTDLNVQGNITARSFSIPAGAIGDTQVSSSANIAASKLGHIHRVFRGQAGAAASETSAVHYVVGATGTVSSIVAGAITPAVGADTCTVDVKKNGTSILSSAISLTNSQAAYAVVSGAISTAGLVVGDVISVVITPSHSTGTLASGVFVAIDVWEAAQ